MLFNLCCRLVIDRETGKPKGYGFCEYKDEETALSARRNLQGYEINGRQLRVDFAENDKGSGSRDQVYHVNVHFSRVFIMLSVVLFLYRSRLLTSLLGNLHDSLLQYLFAVFKYLSILFIGIINDTTFNLALRL